MSWLQDNFDPVFGFPNVARFSWAPVKNALLKKGAASKWCVALGSLSLSRSSSSVEALVPTARALADSPASLSLARRADEPASIQKCFSGKAADPERAALWKDYSLVSVDGF